jgi:ferredoxin
MNEYVYQALADRLDSLPQGFPSAENGSHLRLLAHLFSPTEAALAAQLSPQLESVKELHIRIGGDRGEMLSVLKDLARRGLIRLGRTTDGAGFALEPFVVGFYENQVSVLDETLAALFEDYYLHAFDRLIRVEPQPHRIIPVQQSIANPLEIHPYESVMEIVDRAKAWAVQDCICRKQKALVGEPCGHPMEVCLVMAPVEGAFDNAGSMRAITHQEALAVLKLSADAGLVHSVSNTQEGNYYICNCCTCSCGFLRGMADFGMANVMARSAFVNQVDENLCIACGTCVDACPFQALTLADVVAVDQVRCVGCGVCVPLCPSGALSLHRRPEAEIKPVPRTAEEWAASRLQARA